MKIDTHELKELEERALSEPDPAKALRMLESYLELMQELIGLSGETEKNAKRKAIVEFKIDYTANPERQLNELIVLLGLPGRKLPSKDSVERQGQRPE
jgi:hypothetical protein